MQRLYYLADDAQAAGHIANDLRAQGVTTNHLHLVAENDADLVRNHLEPASPLETTDLLPAGEGGLLVGIALGITACTLSWLTGLLPASSPLAYLGLFIFFTGLGAWFGGFIGLSRRHYKLAGFRDALKKGQVLVIVDTDSDQIARLMNHHPVAHAAGRGSTLNNPLHPNHL